MPKAYYIPADDPGKCTWFNNFATKLPTYSATLAVTGAEETSVLADNDFWQYVCDARNQLNQYAKDWTAYKNGARSGPTLGDLPTPPTLPAAPALVAPNIFGRITPSWPASKSIPVTPKPSVRTSTSSARNRPWTSAP